MYLKSLEIRGFKSFPDKTKLNFDPGITAVVGPNGSGKSNIADAVRWVLGEQSAKTLRGGRMEDVIFGGTQKRNAIGFAKVDITIDNSDHFLDMETDEVVISRKYYRSGESEYRVNGNSVRLRDIHEMLMDTGLGKDGYSMIGQGKIAEIVSAKNTDRRDIFEEAAGISKYRYRKEQSERQLEMAQENLIRLKDIIVEIEDRLEPLRIQSEKALEFVELMNEKKQMEVSLFIHSLSETKETIREHQNKIMVCQSTYDEIEDKIRKIEESTQHVYNSINEISIRVDDFQREKEKLNGDINKNISNIAVLKNDIHHSEENIERLKVELSASKGNTGEIDLHISEKDSEQKILFDSLTQVNKDILDLETELDAIINNSEQHTDEIGKLTAELHNLTEKHSEITLDHITAVSSVAEIQNHVVAVNESMKIRQGQLEQMERDKDSVVEYLSDVEQRLISDKNTLSGYDIKLKSRKNKHIDMTQKLVGERLAFQETSQRVKILEDMENNLEDFSFSVKNIMKMSQKGELDGVHGPVSQLLDVPPDYALAIETALSGGIQNIVVDNENVAKRAINLLKHKRAGRATFLPLTSVKGKKADIREYRNSSGFIGIASELVECDNKYIGIMDYLLGRTILYETLDDGINISKQCGYRFRIVTLDGQVINAGGSLTGGSGVKSAGLLSRRNEINTLHQKKTLLQGKVHDLELQCNEIEGDIRKFQANCDNWSASIKNLEEDKIKYTFRLESLESGIVDGNRQIKQYEVEILESTKRVDGLNVKIKDWESLKDDLQYKIDIAQRELESKDSRRDGLRERMDSLSKSINLKKIDKLAYEKDISAINQFINDLKDRKLKESQKSEDILNDIQNYQNGINSIEDQICAAENTIIRLNQDIENLDKSALDFSNKRTELEKSISGKRQEEKQLLSEKEGISKEIAKLQERDISYKQEYDNIVGKLWDEYEMTVSEGAEFAYTINDLQKTKNRLMAIKTGIKNLGSVNVDSIEEYSQVKQRYEYLSAQYDDVENSRNRLTKMINDLTVTMREIFSQSFSKINENFADVFRELFGGGDAKLSLSDGDDILQSGIDIFVQPPGKIIKNLSSLSGGEQSFVAIAIYFAILKVRPAPFCVLDEIEAALDDINVSKYASYLRKMTNNTQFIAISHRRGTMEEADALYGVTMEEEGISKLLSLQLSEAIDRGMTQDQGN